MSPDVEAFQLLAWKWNVTAAKRYAAGRAAGGHIAPANWSGLLSVIAVDEVHARSVDLTEPLIAVPAPSGDGLLIIDGRHRVHRALANGVERLPVVLLTAEEELRCRIHGGEKGYGRREEQAPRGR